MRPISTSTHLSAPPCLHPTPRHFFTRVVLLSLATQFYTIRSQPICNQRSVKMSKTNVTSRQTNLTKPFPFTARPKPKMVKIHFLEYLLLPFILQNFKAFVNVRKVINSSKLLPAISISNRLYLFVIFSTLRYLYEIIFLYTYWTGVQKNLSIVKIKATWDYVLVFLI